MHDSSKRFHVTGLLLSMASACAAPPEPIETNESAVSRPGAASLAPQLVASASSAPSDGLAFVTILVTPRDGGGLPRGAGLHVEVISSDPSVTLGGAGTSACTIAAPSATCLSAFDSGAGGYVVTARRSAASATPVIFSAAVTDAVGTVSTPDTAQVIFDSGRFTGGTGCAGICGTTITAGTATITSSHAGGRNLYVTGGTVTFDATTVGQTFGDVFIGGGAVNHPQGNNTTMFKLDVNAASWNLLGGTVNTSNQGYGKTCAAGGSPCNGSGYVSFGPGGAPSASLAGTSDAYGGSHGGMGSGNYRDQQSGAANTHFGNAGPTYGDYRDPRFPGAANSDLSGFHGGGVARVVSSGPCVLAGDAAITATTSLNGAGGSINLRCAALISAGWTGVLNADGGRGSGSSPVIGAGGGGRIALVSSGDAATITGALSYPPASLAALTARVHAFGGAPANTNNTVGAGGAGTIYLKHGGLTYGDLIIAANSPAHYANEGTTRLPAIAGTVTAAIAAGATALPVSIASTSYNATYYANAGAPLSTNPALVQNTAPSSSAAYNGVFTGGWLRPDITAAGGALFSPGNLVQLTGNSTGSLAITAAPSAVASGAFFRSIEVLDHFDVVGNAIVETNGDLYVLSGSLVSPGAAALTLNGLALFDTTSGTHGRIEYAAGTVAVVQSTQVMPPIAGGTLVADSLAISGSGALTVPALSLSGSLSMSAGSLTANSIAAGSYIQSAGTLRHYPPLYKTSPASASVSALEMSLTDGFTLSGGTVDVSLLGYPVSANPNGSPIAAYGYGLTAPSTSTGVLSGFGAGHGGVGGGYAGGGRGLAYGDYRDPRFPGGAGITTPGPFGSITTPGGGVIRIRAAGTCTLSSAATLKANASSTAGHYGAAGGSINLRCGSFVTTGWTGTITANGAPAYSGSSLGSTRGGGGGRIALVSSGGAASFTGALTYPLPTASTLVQARGGAGISATYTNGGAGTVFLKHAAAPYGQLLVNNNGQTHYPNGGTTPLISIAGTINGAVPSGATSIGVTITSAPAHSVGFNGVLAGMWLRPDTSVNSGTLPNDNLVRVADNAFVSTSLSTLTTTPTLAAVLSGASFKSVDLFNVLNVVGGAVVQTSGNIYVAP